MYELTLGAGLFLAALLNGNSARSMLLVFLACGVILLLPEFLPSPDLLGEAWFSLLIAVEIAFASLALLIRAPMSSAVAILSCWNIVCHTGAMAALAGNWAIYALYEGFIRGGEVSQVLALIVLSEPLKRLAFAIVDRTKKDSGGGQSRTRLQLA